MELTDFLSVISLIQQSASIDVPVYVHNYQDKADLFFKTRSTNESIAEQWNILLLETEEGWITCDNIGSSDSSFVTCVTASNASLSIPTGYKDIIKHYFPCRSSMHTYDIIQASPYDTKGMIAVLLNMYARLFQKPWPERNVLQSELNMTKIKVYFRKCVISKHLTAMPSWVLRSPLSDQNSIVDPKVYEGLMTKEELNMSHG